LTGRARFFYTAKKEVSAVNAIEQYIRAQPEEYRERLRLLRQTILDQNPAFEEKLAWGMPTFRLNKRNIIHFALAKHHIGLYPGPKAVARFAPRLTALSFSKGTIRLPHAQALPLDLVREITAWCLVQASGIKNKL